MGQIFNGEIFDEDTREDPSASRLRRELNPRACNDSCIESAAEVSSVIFTQSDVSYATLTRNGGMFMKAEAVQAMARKNVTGVALGLLRNRGSKRWDGGDPFAVRRWIEKQLADAGDSAHEMSGIELHREIEAGIAGRAISTLLTALDMTKEEFSEILGRSRKTLNELLQRVRLSRADSDLLYRVSRALVHAVSVFEDAGYAVQWLKAPNEALGGSRPLGLLVTIEGDEVVHAELGAIEHGLPV